MLYCFLYLYNFRISFLGSFKLKECNVICFEGSLALKKRLPGTYPFFFLMYFRQEAMVFSSEEKAVIKSNYEEKGWTTYGICKEHKSKK